MKLLNIKLSIYEKIFPSYVKGYVDGYIEGLLEGCAIYFEKIGSSIFANNHRQLNKFLFHGGDHVELRWPTKVTVRAAIADADKEFSGLRTWSKGELRKKLILIAA
jgi:hypothetical protein